MARPKKSTARTAPKAAPAETKTEAVVETNVKASVEAPKTAAPKKPAAPVEVVHLQFGGNEWTVSDLVERAKVAYAAAGGDVSAITELQLYVKPEEQKAYYVINGEADGSSIDL